jgi:hypothetical protein
MKQICFQNIYSIEIFPFARDQETYEDDVKITTVVHYYMREEFLNTNKKTIYKHRTKYDGNLHPRSAISQDTLWANNRQVLNELLSSKLFQINIDSNKNFS